MTHYCLQCDNGTELIYKKQDITVMCHDKTAIASGIEGWHCPICGECEFANEADSRRHMDTLSALIANVKTDEKTFISNVLKKLGLKQAEADKLFGEGIDSFLEYERGVTQPHKSTVILLRLLDSHPELLKEVRTS